MADGVLIPRERYEMPTVEMSRWLLGKIVVRETPDGPISGVIVETEAYTLGDPACHSFCGPTARNKSMYGPPGHAYIYFSYGCHFMLNLVTQSEGIAEAILIRALDPLNGIDLMRRNRDAPDRIPDRKLCAGPGRLTAALAITRTEFEGVDLTTRDGGLYLLEAPAIPEADVVTGKRIGLTKGVDSPWRFFVRGNPAVSRINPPVMVRRGRAKQA